MSLSNHPPTVEMLSVSAFNAFQRRPENRKTFGKHQHTGPLRQEWRFAGSVKKPHRPIAAEEAVPVIIGGRMRVSDLSRGYVPLGDCEKYSHRGVAGQLDHMWFVYRRYRYDAWLSANIGKGEEGKISDLQLKLEREADSIIRPDEADDFTHCWQVEVWMNRTGSAPPIELYSVRYAKDPKDNYEGDYDHVGFIGFVYGDREFNLTDVDRARTITRGKDGFAKETPALPAIELFTGVY